MIVPGEKTLDIMRAAEAAGMRIARQNLSTVHRRQFIPQPKVNRLGRGRGTESIYPYGTTTQLLAYGRLKQKFGKDYKQIGWELWIQGFSVGEQYYRFPLEDAVDLLVQIAGWAFDIADSKDQPILSEKAAVALDRLSVARSALNTVGRLRRTLRQHGFSTFLRVALEVAAGIFKATSSDAVNERYFFARALGTKASQKKRKPLPVSEWIVEAENFARMLEHIADALSAFSRNPSLGAFSEQEIVEARSELTVLLDFFLSIETVERQVYGQSSPALSLLRLIVGDMNVERHAFFLLVWLIVRRIPTIGEGAQQLLDVINQPPDFSALAA